MIGPRLRNAVRAFFQSLNGSFICASGTFNRSDSSPVMITHVLAGHRILHGPGGAEHLHSFTVTPSILPGRLTSPLW